ncbi:putative ATP-grasp-modified RiPP [Actinomadura graeca]|uniref:ATP-grasp-modified RiPP n=1 Tax=Actinomadura graeca TaxID=2750812 RepID=A0ABX8R438_9ACTN|nr:putative ATP-grasp-modified RiPP [Actinomadura graeca]QXJ25817.1 putative ATP-grasp-modified RiPP [Actinomadura graeca]
MCARWRPIGVNEHPPVEGASPLDAQTTPFGRKDGAGAAPWGWSRAVDRLPESPSDYVGVVLDPLTQTARYIDADDQVIEAGRHGTNKTRGTATKSGGGDGKGPQEQVQDDNTTDYETD